MPESAAVFLVRMIADDRLENEADLKRRIRHQVEDEDVRNRADLAARETLATAFRERATPAFARDKRRQVIADWVLTAVLRVE